MSPIPIKEDAVCPFCKTMIPAGASVCSGCNAEHDYHYDSCLGAMFFGVLLLIAVPLGVYVGSKTFEALGWVVGVGAIVLIVGFVQKRKKPVWIRKGL